MATKGKKGVFGELFITPVGRLIFPAIDEPTGIKDMPNAPKKYSATLIVNSSPEIIKLEDAINTVGRAAFSDWDTKRDKYYTPLSSGAEVLEKINNPSEGTTSLYRDRFRIIAKGNADKDGPQCFLADKSKMMRRPGNADDLKAIREQFYAGSFCRLYVTPFSFNPGGNKGVGLILKAIQFYKDGSKMGIASVDDKLDTPFADEGPWDDEVTAGVSEAEDAFSGEELPDTGDVNV